jgi:tRNA threonylcarbamoyladenosine biosynthesis protein TsaB
MNILAVDTAAEPLSLALQAGGKVYAYDKTLARPHDETLIPAVNRLLKAAGLEVGALDAVAAACGPGRFTGIRIGMAYAAVLAARLGKPALALTRFEAAAEGAAGDKVCAVVPGFREEKFYQMFARRRGVLRPSGEPVWAAPEDWALAREKMENEGVVIAQTQATARGLLPAAHAALGGRRRRFEPLYLKPAGYENKARKPL